MISGSLFHIFCLLKESGLEKRRFGVQLDAACRCGRGLVSEQKHTLCYRRACVELQSLRKVRRMGGRWRPDWSTSEQFSFTGSASNILSV